MLFWANVLQQRGCREPQLTNGLLLFVWDDQQEALYCHCCIPRAPFILGCPQLQPQD